MILAPANLGSKLGIGVQASEAGHERFHGGTVIALGVSLCKAVPIALSGYAILKLFPSLLLVVY